MNKHIWFCYTDYTGNSSDYSVSDWDAAKVEAAKLIKPNIGFVCNKEIELKIESLLETDWKQAVLLYNKHNAMKEFIACREGK